MHLTGSAFVYKRGSEAAAHFPNERARSEGVKALDPCVRARPLNKNERADTHCDYRESRVRVSDPAHPSENAMIQCDTERVRRSLDTGSSRELALRRRDGSRSAVRHQR
jgi:hypothetical protein